MDVSVVLYFAVSVQYLFRKALLHVSMCLRHHHGASYCV